MKYIWSLLLLVIVFLAGCSQAAYKEPFPSDSLLDTTTDSPVLLLFHGSGCPHCHEEIAWLEQIQSKYPSLEIRSAETWQNKANAVLFQEMAKAYGQEAKGVPGTFIGDQFFVGFSDATKNEMEDAIAACVDTGCENPAARLRK